nr:PREDICTED: fer-1-like protein 5 [Anolis carolinensis]XP_016854253.1 PREDICTED: fer-1-like protein 5 [Anolis carolinensis]XP_016854254.1 PREDICTED: fer-1-like protein 5 [Anolis carolinensis]|eukprot:XP_008122013.1 PREDICTED: fer-1-like protein 5 [Anolis carolinensis]
MFRLVVVSAHLLIESTDLPDTYVTGSFNGVEKDTRVVQKEPNPVWNETLVWYLDNELPDVKSFATVHCREWNPKPEARDFGIAKIHLAEASEKLGTMLTLRNLPLKDRDMKPTGCTITIRVCFSPLEPALRPTLDTTKYCLQKLICCPICAKESVLEEVGAQETRAIEMPSPNVAMKELANKKQEFQVRVRILECRQLQENNIKPVVKVYIGDQVFRTRIKAGNNPFYNEIFVKNYNEMPLRLFDQFITIQVLNSRAIRADSLIGVFKVSVSYFWVKSDEIGALQVDRHVLITAWDIPQFCILPLASFILLLCTRRRVETSTSKKNPITGGERDYLQELYIFFVSNYFPVALNYMWLRNPHWRIRC